MCAMRGNVGNYHDKLSIMRILFVSKSTLADMTGTTPNLADRNTNPIFAKSNQQCWTTDISYSAVICILCPSSSCSFLLHPQLYHLCKIQS